MPDRNHKIFKTNISILLSMQLKVRKNELFECLAVGDSVEDVLHSVGSLGENVGEVLLGEGAVAAVSSDEGSEGGSDLVVEVAEVLLVEDEGFIGVSFIFGAWEGGVDLFNISEDLVNPLGSSFNVLVGGGGVVVGKIEEGIGVASDLVKSLDGAKQKISKSIAKN
jgi:hypothetical protein